MSEDKLPLCEDCEDSETQQPTAEISDCCRKKIRSQEEYQHLIHRLNRIEGQIRGIRGMVERDAYCPNILVQVSAATAALNSFSKELLAEHIHTCVAHDIRAGRDDAIDELVNLLLRLMR